MNRNIASKVTIPLSLIAVSCVGISSAAIGQGMMSPGGPGGQNGFQQQNGQGVPRSGTIVAQKAAPTQSAGPTVVAQRSTYTPPPAQSAPTYIVRDNPQPAAHHTYFTATMSTPGPITSGVPHPMPRQSTWPSPWNYVYPNSDGSAGYTPIVENAPQYLGGYYYGNYCTDTYYPDTYPNIYSAYDGLPDISNSSVVVLGQPVYPQYVGTSQDFDPDQSQSQPTNVTYNQNNYNTNNYYVQAPATQTADPQVKTNVAPTKASFDTGSYQAAFTDIAKAFTDGNIDLIQDHLRDSDTKVSVNLHGKYAYSISSDDFAKITKDALANLNTVSFDFTRLRKAKNGEVTAYGTHTYLVVTQASAPASTTPPSKTSSDDDNATVPFDQSDSSDAKATDGSVVSKKVYVSFTLRQSDSQWYIVSVDSSAVPLVPDQE